MSLEECMEKHTYRQYQAWLAWLSLNSLTEVTKDQLYLAQIAMEVRRVLSYQVTKSLEKVNEAKLDDFILKEKEKPTVTTVKERLALATLWAKARWSGIIRKS